jgi:predicted nuclease of restriction endonuclease-like (RecB) superfamily
MGKRSQRETANAINNFSRLKSELYMKINENLYAEIKRLIEHARNNIVKSVNWAMVITHWEIGRRIVDEEQHGQERAVYGQFLIKNLSEKLTQEFGKGFDARELRKMRQFYLYFPIRDALRPELTWTHYRLLLRVEDTIARTFYLAESIDGSWSSRQLERQISSFYYQRLLSSKDKNLLKAEADNTNNTLKPVDFLKDPFVLEFLNIETINYLERDLEDAILDNLQAFILELGKGFSFVARQQRIVTEAGKLYKIDLVFYNYLLKCFVLIDLKIGTLEPQDVGQMDMYVRLYEDQKKPQGDNPTLGIILCSQRDDTVVQFSILNGSEQLFASQYQLYLPTKEQLKQWLENQHLFLSMKSSDEDTQ